MRTSMFLATRLEEVYISGTWIANTNYKAQLQSLSWRIAILKIADLNTIAELTFHMNYYLKGILDALKTSKLTIKDQYSFDAPIITSQIEWNDLVENLLNNAESFIKAVEQMDDNTLDSFFFEEKYGTYLKNIHGVIEHSYYHLGQIAMLKKLIAEN